MNILESLLYGLIAGFAEYLPISSQGHQALLKHIFGVTSPEPLRDIFLHIAVLAAVMISGNTYFQRLKKELSLNQLSSRKRAQQSDRRIAQDLRLIKASAIPMLICLFLNLATFSLRGNLGFVALFFVINGIALYIPEHLSHCNKNANQLSALDSFLIGICSALSVLPGISRVGAGLSCAIIRGADQEKAYNWILALSVPALMVLLICDIVRIFFTGFGTITFLSFLGYIISAAAGFGGAFVGISVMRLILSRTDCTVFGFYSWGAALLSFLLYLFV